MGFAVAALLAEMRVHAARPTTVDAHAYHQTRVEGTALAQGEQPRPAPAVVPVYF